MSTSNQSQIAFENGPELPAEGTQGRTTGILPSQEITNLIARGNISASPAINPDHIQPASLDLRLGDMAHRVRASFLPGPNGTVEAKIKELRMTRVDLTGAPVFGSFTSMERCGAWNVNVVGNSSGSMMRASSFMPQRGHLPGTLE